MTGFFVFPSGLPALSLSVLLLLSSVCVRAQGLSVLPDAPASPDLQVTVPPVEQGEIVGCWEDATRPPTHVPRTPRTLDRGSPGQTDSISWGGLCGGTITYTYRCVGKLFYPDQTWGSWTLHQLRDNRRHCGCGRVNPPPPRVVDPGSIRTVVVTRGECGGSLTRKDRCIGNKEGAGSWNPLSTKDTRVACAKWDQD